MASYNIWEAKYHDKCKELAKLQENSRDYERASQNYEEDLEKELEATHEELQRTTEKLGNSRETITKMQRQSDKAISDFTVTIDSLMKQISKISEEKTRSSQTLQQLEQQKDDLERKLRISEFSAADLKQGLEDAMEENINTKCEFEELKQEADKTVIQLKEYREKLGKWQSTSIESLKQTSLRRTAVSDPRSKPTSCSLRQAYPSRVLLNARAKHRATQSCVPDVITDSKTDMSTQCDHVNSKSFISMMSSWLWTLGRPGCTYLNGLACLLTASLWLLQQPNDSICVPSWLIANSPVFCALSYDVLRLIDLPIN